MNSVLLVAEQAQGGMGNMYSIVLIIAMVAIFYFMLIRPQRKDQKRKQEMFAAMAVGDTVLTTSGFYGTIIDIRDDTIVVEFGNNRNCRIPMQRAAIAAVEKAEDAFVRPEKAEKTEKVEKVEKVEKAEANEETKSE